MGSVPPLLAFLLMVVSGWVHRRQLIVIEFLQAENRLLNRYLDALAPPTGGAEVGLQQPS